MTDALSSNSSSQFHVVGIGASAGGLEALIDLFRALPADTGMAFVIVQHLEPHHESQLADILARASSMPVVQAQEGQAVEPNHVYVIPPNTTMVLQQGALHLAPRPESPRPHYPIDLFFESLGEDQGAKAIAVVLSGSASDGAHGVRAIKSRLGATFAQNEQSAKYGSMPHSAIATGAVDFVLPPARIADELARIDSHPFLTAPLEQLEEPLEAEENGDFRAILDRLKTATSVDFSQYKHSTIRRRLGRRLVVHHLETLGEYLEYLDSHFAEIHDLYRDILISVTSFFREAETFEAMAKALEEYLGSREGSDPLRIWVPGCATGEEAYSLAMVSFEVLQKLRKDFPIQLFGTDISDSAIDRARAGVYPQNAAEDIPPERLQRFFTHVDSGIRIKQQIRDCCIFAKHDLTSDPPFSQMDVVSCRNVFIYLNAALQRRVLPALHYSLKPGGLLILGSAETVGSRSDLFGALDRERKIYTRHMVPARFPLDLNAPALQVGAAGATPFRPPVPMPTLVDLEARAARIMRDLYAPAGVLIDEDMHVLHAHGQTGMYLEQTPVQTGVNLLRVTPENLLGPLRRAIREALAQKQPVHGGGVKVEHEGQTREIKLSVIPLSGDARFCLVLFEDEGRHGGRFAPAGEGGVEAGPLELELSNVQRELAQNREYLSKVIEQHESATEELRAANEESCSSNEELQSTNEELRTAKEQLQSSNEELTTVNDELKFRNIDLTVATNDLSNILHAVTIPILMVDLGLRLRRFTPTAERLLGLAAADIGRPISDIHIAVQVPQLQEMLVETLQTLGLQERRVQDHKSRWWHLFVRPYRTVDERIDGAVLAFIDIDETTRALEVAESARQFADAMVETVQHPLLVLDNELRVLRATGAFYRSFGVQPEDTVGQTIDNLGNGQWKIPDLRQLLEQALVRNTPFRDFEVSHEFPHIGRRVMRLNARRIVTTEDSYTLLLAIEDVTERQHAAEVQFRQLFASAKDGVIVVNASSGTVVDVNPFFLEMSLYPRSELLNRPLREIPPFRDIEQIGRLVSETPEKGALHHDSVHLHARDGREFIVDLIANSYRVKEQAFVQLNVRDVTDRRRAEERLQSANLDLQQFAFAASHDLQEPLRTITSHLELLKRRFQGKLDAQADQHIGFVTAASDRMRQLVLDLLGYSQVVRAELKLAPVNVEAVLSTVLMNLQMAIQSSDARITFDPLPTVYMDETQLIQLLQNLISNAIKYRSEAPPQIHISAREAGPECIVSVQDNGIGIDMKYADQIFTVFKRLHGRNYPGTGIGLAVCKRIVERRGGRIWVESEPGKGSTFYFSVPKWAKQD